MQGGNGKRGRMSCAKTTSEHVCLEGLGSSQPDALFRSISRQIKIEIEPCPRAGIPEVCLCVIPPPMGHKRLDPTLSSKNIGFSS